MPKKVGKSISDGTVAVLKDAKKGENNVEIGKCGNVEIGSCALLNFRPPG